MARPYDRLMNSALAARVQRYRLAKATKRSVEALANPREFARGYRFGRRIESPLDGAVTSTTSPLEEYFDAHHEGHGIWKSRHYFDIYHRHLAKFRDRPVHLVEVGVYSGGSLEMWRDYFGPECRIYGVDTEADCRIYEDEVTKIFIGDQADPEFWRSFLKEVPEIDAVVDDGGHQFYQQRTTLECLLPAMRPGGVYICEDIEGPSQPFNSFIDGLSHAFNPSALDSPSPLHQHVASIHRYPMVTVIEKQASRVDSFEPQRQGTLWQPFFQ